MNTTTQVPIKPFAAYVADEERVTVIPWPTVGGYNYVTQEWDYGNLIIEAGGCGGATKSGCRFSGCRISGASGRDCSWECSDKD